MRRSTFLFISLILFVVTSCTPKPAENRTTVVHPDWTGNAVIYQINVRQFTKEGTLAAVEQQFDRLKELGVDVLYLTPIAEIGKQDRQGELGYYRAIRNYKEIDREFGDWMTLRAFVKNAHEKGFKVIFDWVGDETSSDAVWTSRNGDWYVQDTIKGGISIDPEHPDVAKLDYNNTALWVEMAQAMTFWSDKGVDGYRADFGRQSLKFINEITREMREVRKNSFYITTSENAALQRNAFDAYSANSQRKIWEAVAKGEVSADSLANFYALYAENTGMPEGTMAMNYLTDDQINSFVGSAPEIYGADAVKAFAVLSFTVPGIPMIYNGEEIGLDRKLAPYEKDSIDWSRGNNDLTAFYKDLISLRKNHICLWSQPAGGTMAILPSDHPEKVFVFEREAEGDMCLAMFNFSNEEVTFNVENHIVTTDKEFTLPPYGYHLIFSVGNCFGNCDLSEFDHKSE